MTYVLLLRGHATKSQACNIAHANFMKEKKINKNINQHDLFGNEFII